MYVGLVWCLVGCMDFHNSQLRTWCLHVVELTTPHRTHTEQYLRLISFPAFLDSFSLDITFSLSFPTHGIRDEHTRHTHTSRKRKVCVMCGQTGISKRQSDRLDSEGKCKRELN